MLLSFYKQLTVEGMYVLAVLEKDETRKKVLMDKFTKEILDHAKHLQPGYTVV